MNKKQFLETLMKKLSVLNESERQDIIEEYTDTINEKVKNGMTEKAAVKDFGDIDDLVKEILKAYKINPNYDEKSESFGKKSEVIKEGAGRIAEFSRRLARKFTNANNITVALVIEILIKVFLVLIALSILGMATEWFTDLGESIFENFFSPFSDILSVIWYVFLFSLFVLISVMLVIAVFKKYFEGNEKETKTITKETKPSKNGTNFSDVLLLIVKIIIILWVIIPLMFIDLFAIIGLVLSIVYMFKGLDLIGLVLIGLGIVSLITYIIVLLFKLVIGKPKISIISPIVSAVIIVIGGILFTTTIMEIEYIDKAPKGTNKTIYSETLNIAENTKIHYNQYYNRNYDVKVVTDNNMQDGEIKLDIQYNKKLYDINISREDIKEECDYEECNTSLSHYINIDYIEYNEINEAKMVYNLLIDNLKAKKIYNYRKIYTGTLTITANEKTQKMFDIE